MRVAFGLTAHSGWAALVVLGDGEDGPVVLDRRRIELVDDRRSRQPYHAAQPFEPDAARALVARLIATVRRLAVKEIRAALKRAKEQEHDVAACAVIVGEPLPPWSVDEILAVHFRMHKAEGVLFRDALTDAARACGLRHVAVSANSLGADAEKALGLPASRLLHQIASLGRSVGPPWGKDQKDAALAALVALRRRSDLG
jgi:hypothetical protein